MVDMITRRKVVKSLGSSIVGLGVIGSTSATSERERFTYRDIAQSIRKVEGHDKYRQFLKRHSIPFDGTRIGWSRQSGEDTIGTNAVTCIEPDDECELEMKVDFELVDWPYLGLFATTYVDYDTFSYPGSSPDAIAIAWDPGYKIRTHNFPANSMSSPEATDWDDGSYNQAGEFGTNFEVIPSQVGEDEPRWEGDRWVTTHCDVDLERTSEHDGDSRVKCVVNHTWSSTKTNVSWSLGVTPTGPSLGITLSQNKIQKSDIIGTDEDGRVLIAREPSSPV